MEANLEYKDEILEELRQDNKEIKKDINNLTIAVMELSNTLKIREDDSHKLMELETEVHELKATIRTLKYILPMLFTVITVVVSAAGVIIDIIM